METTYCDRCGQAITQVFTFGGGKYGATCIEAVCGFSPRFLDVDAELKEAKAQKIAAEKSEKAEAERIAEAESRRTENQQKYAPILECLGTSDFEVSLTRQVIDGGMESLSDKQYYCLKNCYLHGLRGKERNAAEAFFYDLSED